MKVCEVKRVGPGSVFKFYFILGLVIGLIISLVLVFTGVSLNSLGHQLGTVNLRDGGVLQVSATILGIIIVSLAYGLLSGVLGAIGAIIYNTFAVLVGGITVKLNEKE